MPPIRKKRVLSNNKRNNVKRNMDRPPDSVTRYNGSVRSNPVQDGIVVTLNEVTDAAVTNGGTVETNIFPSIATSAVGWSAFVALYREFRVLAMEVKWVPAQTARFTYNSFNATANTEGITQISPMNSIIVHDAESPTSVADWPGQTSFDLQPANKMYKRVIKMNAVEEADFQETDNPQSVFSIGFSFNYTETGTLPTEVIGQFLTRRKVQFRTKWAQNSLSRVLVDKTLIATQDENSIEALRKQVAMLLLKSK